MQIAKVACPTCGASVSVPPGAEQAQCAYCGSALSVNRGAKLPAGTAVPAPAETHPRLPSGIRSDVADLALLRAQAVDDLRRARMELADVRRQVSDLASQPPTPGVRRELIALHEREALLEARIVRLESLMEMRDLGSPFELLSAVEAEDGLPRSIGGGGAVFLLVLVGAVLLLLLVGQGTTGCVPLLLIPLALLAGFFLYRGYRISK